MRPSDLDDGTATDCGTTSDNHGASANRSPALKTPRYAGLLLAAGAGTRFGGPKALAVDKTGEPWVVHAARALADAGCDPVLIVLGAGGAQAEAMLRSSVLWFENPGVVRVVHAENWADGLSASLRAGLADLAGLAEDGDTGTPIDAVVLVPVDVPDLSAAVIRRLASEVTSRTLRQAHFAGNPGHPVVIGREHWSALEAGLAGDTGARPYLVEHGVQAVDCDDLGTGLDVDTPRTTG
jgi:CTP:molybdopterin cytidylyltransferase MocA